MDRERLKGNLDLLLLSVLSSGPAHGYAIISALRDRSGGTFDLPEGTIYPALHRLEDAGLLVSTWDRARHHGPGSAVPGGDGGLLPAGIGTPGRAHRERLGMRNRVELQEEPDHIGVRPDQATDQEQQ